MTKTCPNCQSKCKDFDLNIVNIDDFKVIQKLANTEDFNFTDIGLVVWNILGENKYVD